MANEEQLAKLKQGMGTWNEWREQNTKLPVDLSYADLTAINLSGMVLGETPLGSGHFGIVNLSGDVNLSHARFAQARLDGADLSNSNLTGANFQSASLAGANLTGADLTEADLSRTILAHADFSDATLTGANLIRAMMVETNLSNAELSNCRIFGISTWNVKLEGATQSNLVITQSNEPAITVDNLEIAQFIYLLLHNEKLRDVIDTVGKKSVLILGRFTDERKAVLEAIRAELRRRDYIPIVFDFKPADSRDITETVRLLANMARFVIADLTDPRSLPHELMSFVEGLPSVAVRPLILNGQDAYGMFGHFLRYPWVLPIHEYDSQDQLIAELADKVIKPAEAKVLELRPPTP